MIKLLLGLLLALLSSACFAGGYIGQHQAITDAPLLQWRNPIKSFRQLLKSRMWLLGYLGGLLGWGVYIAALCFAPLSVVQVISASCIGVIAYISRRNVRRTTDRSNIAKYEFRFAVPAIIGLGLVLGFMRWTYHPVQPSFVVVLCFVGTGLVIAGVLATIARENTRGALFGIISGICYGVSDVATKAAVDGRHILIPVFLVCSALGFATLQLSYQRSSLFASAGLSALFTNAIPIFAGAVIFHESPLHGVNAWMQGVGFVLVIVAAVGLAASESSPTSLVETQLT